MKKSILLISFLSFSFQLIGQQLKIVASASMISDIANNVIGDLHDIEMIVPIGGDPHLHEPTPSNARQVASADLILINGLTFEGWITELIDNSGTEGRVITVTDGVNVLSSETYQNSADPHAWMDAANGIIYAENIKSAISKLDPDNATTYSSNFENYKAKLNALDQEILQSIKTIPSNQRVLITSHDAFQYYGRKYGIRLEAIMGISTEAEAQTADIIRVNKVIRENNVPALFIESTINPKLIQQLASDNDVSIGGSLFADSLGDKKTEASTYIDMLRYNTKTIVEALRKERKAGSHQTSESKKSSNLILYLGLIGLLFLITVGTIYKMRS